MVSIVQYVGQLELELENMERHLISFTLYLTLIYSIIDYL